MDLCVDQCIGVRVAAAAAVCRHEPIAGTAALCYAHPRTSHGEAIASNAAFACAADNRRGRRSSAADAFRQVNPVHNSFDLWELTELSLEVAGCAYWLLDVDPILNVPSAIWILPSH